VFKKVKDLDKLSHDAESFKEKWFGKEEISNYMRDHVLLPFAEGVSLDIKVAFHILNEYFKLNHHQYMYFFSLTRSLDNITQQMAQVF
jgi:hypothetical protein